jgi:hypothetical protein
MPDSHESDAMIAVEPNRLRQISQRLEDGFYTQALAAERVAAAVLADIRDLDRNSPTILR